LIKGFQEKRMEKIFNLTSTFKSHTEDDGSIMIKGMASTADFDRAGDSISADAWTKGGLNNFEKNPIILFNHDYNRPIGRATGLKSTENGLELTAKISKAAKDVAELVKDGVLGAFSVGFRVKDADYLEETDGLRIKDAELFEVSVVSVPCNQSATFSLAKSFDSMDEYDDFKKTFTNSDGTKVQKEIQMSEETQQPVDLEAFAKKVAEETAAKIAMKQAEQKAADMAVQKELEDQATANAEAKAQQEEEVKTAIISGVESGATRLVEDMQKEFEAAKAEEISALTKKYEGDVKEKADELESMRNRKYEFSTKSTADLGREALEAKVFGAITQKGWNTDLGQQVQEKAVSFGAQTTSGNLDITVSQQFEEEVKLETRLLGLFREIQVTSGATVMPFASDVNPATFGTTFDIDTANQRIDNVVAGTNGQYDVANNVLNTQRLAAGTYIDNDVDETSLVSFLPMITSALARSHAVATDKAILYGTAGVTAGIAGGNGNDKGTGFRASTSATTAQLDGTTPFGTSMLEAGRAAMGKYAVNPTDVVYVVSIDAYYDILAEDGDFRTVDKAGSDVAANINGMMGTLFGSPVIVSAELAPANAGTVALVINTSRFIIGRLRGVSIETDYEVGKQRNILVASQALGFKALEGVNGAHALTLLAN
jgi:HK97 family phage prohead protease